MKDGALAIPDVLDVTGEDKGLGRVAPCIVLIGFATLGALRLTDLKAVFAGKGDAEAILIKDS